MSNETVGKGGEQPHSATPAGQRAQALTRIAIELASQIADGASHGDAVAEIVREALGVTAASVVVFDPENDSRIFRGAAGFPPGWDKIPLPTPSEMAKLAAIQPAVVVRRPADVASGNVALDTLDFRVLASAKILHAGRFLGFVSALSFGRDHRFEPDDLDWLIACSGIVGPAFMNAQLVSALRNREERYREIVDSSFEGIMVIDRDNTVVFANPRMGELLGCDPSRLAGTPLASLVHEAGRGRFEAALERVAQGARERFEVRFKRDNGVDLWTMVSACSRSDDAGAPAGAVVLVLDLSQVRALEARAQQVQKLESLAALAGGIAHDFNNLLAGVLGNASLALMELPLGHPVRSHLEEINAAARRAADLTKHMLAYSGKGRFRLERLSPNAVVEQALPALSAVVPPDIRLELELSANVPDVDCDAAQLRQVLDHLITNAVEAIDGVGTITIVSGAQRADRAFLRSTVVDDSLAEGLYAYLEVKDTGSGVDPTVLSRLFDPFFTTKFTGRGLGLAATLGILRGHRGAIHVSSVLGRGSQFRVLLPAALASVALPAKAPQLAAVKKTQGTILVADDEPAVRSVATRVLSRAGFDVVAAADGREALELLEAHGDSVVAVLLDLTMPNLGGEETMSQIHLVRPGLPIVLTSGYDERALTASEGDAVPGFIQKPWSPSELLAVMKEAVARGQADRSRGSQ